MRVHTESYLQLVWRQYRRHPLGVMALFVLALFVLAGTYAPLLASSKPLVVKYAGDWYLPLFRYLFFTGFYNSALDLFFNLLMFTLPLALLAWWLPRRPRLRFWIAIALTQAFLFALLFLRPSNDPSSDPSLTLQRLRLGAIPLTWDQELSYMNAYAKLNLVLREQQRQTQDAHLKQYVAEGHTPDRPLATRWQNAMDDERANIERFRADAVKNPIAKIRLANLLDRRRWIAEQESEISFQMMPLLRPYHWEDDAGGDQTLNRYVPWWEVTRSGHRDLGAALIFGIRVSLVVGLLAVGLALLIGIPVGCLSGFYGGWTDIGVCRVMEIWEAMPTFFMLLFIVAVTQSHSIILVILVIGIFGWTGFSRYIRGEFFKQRNLPYVEACRAIGFNDSYIMFRHILPNAIPPVLTLVPFAIMGAISTEAGLSFLGLGEADSCSWGVLMDEGRQGFPAQAYLMWPPAILLTVLLVIIALIGDALRDAIDPRLHVE